MIKKIIGTIYVSSDGKQFVDKTECLEYEKKINFDNLKYYRVLHEVISAKSSYYRKCTYFAIAEPIIEGSNYNGLDALESYCIANYLYLNTPLFYIDKSNNYVIRRYTRPVEITKKEFFSDNREMYDERIYFSDYPITQLDNEGVQRLGYKLFQR